MKKTLIGSTLAAALLISTSLALALDATVKTPDVKGATKASVEGSKAGAKATLDSSKAAAANAKSAVKSRIIDINSASEAELKAVPGIGDTYATKIIAGRPYTNKTQLKSRNIMPAPVYDKVKDLVVAKQAAKKAVTIK